MRYTHTVLTLLLTLHAAMAVAQTWTEVKSDPAYLWGEGTGATLAEADRHALADLTSRIAVQVESRFDVSSEERLRNGQSEMKSYVRDCVNTYAQATLTNTTRFVLADEPAARVGRAIRKDEVERLFVTRRNKAADMVLMGLKAESEGRLDDALRQMYWAHLLTRSLQRPGEATFTDAGGQTHRLMVWIPQHINELLGQVRIATLRRQGDDVELGFTFRGRPVASLDFTYFDGRDWSPVCSAQDGVGTIELAEGYQSGRYQVKVEYEYASQAHIDKELEQVMRLEGSLAMSKASFMVEAQQQPAAQPAAQPVGSFSHTPAGQIAAPQPLAAADARAYADAMTAVQRAIESHSAAGLEPYFEPEALDMFRQLLFHYGRPRIVGTPAVGYYQKGSEVVARGLQVGLNFSSGARRSFVEDLVLTFNASHRVTNVAFGLGKTAENDILNNGIWSDTSRKALMDFLENYKTAFALKRLDYLKTIFDDEAIIIVGNVVKRASQMGVEAQAMRFADQQHVRYARYTKREYLRKLERCFRAQEFINLHFADNQVYKLGKGGEMYGIQIAQDYYSSTYGDQGYLLLIIDLNNPQLPVIKVRTWQPEKDPNFGLWTAADFR
ncbi:MAG: hypothetical protein K5928_09020 [Prevotella sp.]|nr:hypothetical protein [Prevotella sp.]